MSTALAETPLPVLHQHPGELALDDIEATVARIEAELPHIDDLRVLKEWESQAEGLWRYLRDRDLHKPIQGTQRKIEARIGQLLSPPRRGKAPVDARIELERQLFPHTGVRTQLRYLGRALSGEVKLSDEEWQQGRDTLVHLIRGRLGEFEYAGKVGPAPTERRRRKWQSARGQGKRTEWLRNAVTNAAAAADLAYDLSDHDTIKQLTTEERKVILAEARRAIKLLERVTHRAARH